MRLLLQGLCLYNTSNGALYTMQAASNYNNVTSIFNSKRRNVYREWLTVLGACWYRMCGELCTECTSCLHKAISSF